MTLRQSDDEETLRKGTRKDTRYKKETPRKRDPPRRRLLSAGNSPVLADLTSEAFQMIVVAPGLHHELEAGNGSFADCTVALFAE